LRAEEAVGENLPLSPIMAEPNPGFFNRLFFKNKAKIAHYFNGLFIGRTNWP